MELTGREKDWVRRKWQLIRQSQQKADAANAKWEKLTDEINSYLDRKGEADIVQRDRIKSESLALRDALESGGWHSRNAERHIHDVQLFLKIKELGVL